MCKNGNPFSLAHNYLIEKAYYDQQKEVIIDDSIISLRQMVFKKKGDKVSQTPVRRINWKDDKDGINRYERYFETELPQPANQTSRSLGDFLSFQSPEVSQFTELFQDLEKRNDVDGLNSQIIPKLCISLQKEFDKERPAFKTTKIRASKKNLQLEKKECDNDKVLRSLKKEFSSFEEFYGQILQTWTMNSLLYQNLNKYLKTENWLEIKHLAPYAFCLCQAFFYQKLNSYTEIQETKSLILYRGTALNDLELGVYDLKTREDFSWNSIISTTTKKEVAESFMYKSVDLKNNKYPVMFIIEIPNSESYLNWMDIHQYSVMPSEGEVLLAPGSTYTLETIFTRRGGITTICMKLKENGNDDNEIEEELIKLETKEEDLTKFEIKKELIKLEIKEEELIIPDQKEEKIIAPSPLIHIKDREACIFFLEGEELLQALEFISQQTLIEKIEFNLEESQILVILNYRS